MRKFIFETAWSQKSEQNMTIIAIIVKYDNVHHSKVNDIFKNSHLVIRPGLSTASPKAASYSAVLGKKQNWLDLTRMDFQSQDAAGQQIRSVR